MRLLSGGKLFFFGQQVLLAEQTLVTKNVIKVYEQVIGDFIRFLQIYLRLLCVYFFL